MNPETKISGAVLVFALVLATGLGLSHIVQTDFLSFVFGGVIGWASHAKRTESKTETVRATIGTTSPADRDTATSTPASVGNHDVQPMVRD